MPRYTRDHIALLIFSGSLIGSEYSFHQKKYYASNQTTREYEKCNMDLCTKEPIFQGADGSNKKQFLL